MVVMVVYKHVDRARFIGHLQGVIHSDVST